MWPSIKRPAGKLDHTNRRAGLLPLLLAKSLQENIFLRPGAVLALYHGGIVTRRKREIAYWPK